MYDYKLPIDFIGSTLSWDPQKFVPCPDNSTCRVSNKARLFMFEHLTDEQLVINLNSSQSPLFETSHDLI